MNKTFLKWIVDTLNTNGINAKQTVIDRIILLSEEELREIANQCEVIADDLDPYEVLYSYWNKEPEAEEY